jgi:hypothetical protein
MHNSTSITTSDEFRHGHMPAVYADDLKREYPAAIAAKYPDAFPASNGLTRLYSYQGPAVKTFIRCVGNQAFEVEDEEGVVLAALASPVGRAAFDAAVTVAECRGLPWMVSGSSEVFDPVRAERWSYKCTAH